MKKERDSLLTSSISVFALQKRQLPLFAPTDFPRERFDRWTSLWHLVTSGKANLHRGDKANNCKEAIRRDNQWDLPEKRPEQMEMAGCLTRWQ